MPTARSAARPAVRRLRARLVWRPNTPAAAQRPEGFTLVELIVAIVLIGLLAALAVPAFRAVTGRVHDRVALAEMAAVSRHAAALISLDGATSVGFSEEALAASLAGAPEAYASEDGQVSYRTERTAAGFALLEENTSSEAYGDVSWNIADDGSAIGLAMRSRSGRCAWVTGDRTGAVQEGVTDAPEGQCIRLADGGGEGGGTEGDGPGPVIPDPEDFPYDDIECGQLAPMTAATEECKVPDEDDERVGDPIDVPAPGGHDPDEVTAAFHALTSFVHPSWPAPHRMLVTQPASGRVVMVRQNSNTTPGNASATVFATGLPGASGIVVGPDPSTPAGGGVLVLYPVYVGTSANGGSIVRIQPETRTKTTVATNLGGTPTSLATGARCLTASGSFTSGWCIYATVGDTVKTVNVNNGAVTTIHTATTELRAVQPIAGPALVVSSAAGTHTVTGAQLSGTTPAALPATTSPATGGLTWQGNHPAGTQAGLVGTWGTRASGLVGPSGQSVTLPDATDVHAHGNLDTLYATAGSCVHRVSWRNDGVTAPGGVRATPSVVPLWCAGGGFVPDGPLLDAPVLTSSTLLTGISDLGAVANDGTHLYYTSGTALHRVGLDGGSPTLVATLGSWDTFEARSAVVAGGRVYLAAGTDTSSRVLEVTLSTGQVADVRVEPAFGRIQAVAVTRGGAVLWTRDHQVHVRWPDGTYGVTSTDSYGSISTSALTSLTVDDTYVYATHNNWVIRRPLDRSEAWVGVIGNQGGHIGNAAAMNLVRGRLFVLNQDGTRLSVSSDASAAGFGVVAGTGTSGLRDGTGNQAWMDAGRDLTVTPDGNTLVLADRGSGRLRSFVPGNPAALAPPIPSTPTLASSPTQLTTTAADTVTVDASHAYYVRGTTLYRVPLSGGAVQQVAQFTGWETFTAHGSAITAGVVYIAATTDSTTRLLAVDVATGSYLTIATSAPASGITRTAIAHDGTVLWTQGSVTWRMDHGGRTSNFGQQVTSTVTGLAASGSHAYTIAHSWLRDRPLDSSRAWDGVNGNNDWVQGTTTRSLAYANGHLFTLNTATLATDGTVRVGRLRIDGSVREAVWTGIDPTATELAVGPDGRVYVATNSGVWVR